MKRISKRKINVNAKRSFGIYGWKLFKLKTLDNDFAVAKCYISSVNHSNAWIVSCE